MRSVQKRTFRSGRWHNLIAKWPSLIFRTVLSWSASQQDGTAMVDRLKRSLEQLEEPICPKCSIEMVWLRSSLVDDATVAHVFICAGCTHRTEAKTTVRASATPPSKLSAPRERQTRCVRESGLAPSLLDLLLFPIPLEARIPHPCRPDDRAAPTTRGHAF